MPEKPIMHGRDHRPGGTDPIPGLSSGGAEWCYASRVTNFSMPSGGSPLPIPWTHFATSNSSVFTNTTNTNTDDTINGLEAGIYIASTQVQFATPQSYGRSCAITTSFFGVSGAVQSNLSDSNLSTTQTGENFLIHDTMIMVTQSVPGTIVVEAINNDTSAHNLVEAFLMIAFFPNSTLVS